MEHFGWTEVYGRKIVEYRLVRTASNSFDEIDFNHEINELINDGWQPFGNIFTVGGLRLDDCIVLYQPMVKYEET